MSSVPQPEWIKHIPEDDRMTTFPIARPEMFRYYDTALKCFWPVTDVSTKQDVVDYNTKLTPNEQRFVKYVLAFFAASDGIVNLNIATRFKADVNIPEASYFYNYQMMTEDIHAHMYSILLHEIIPTEDERNYLLDAAKNIPIIGQMSQYMYRCIASSDPFPERLLRMGCVEGIFFAGCFCAIYWLQNRGLMPGLGHSNELIARDEGLHANFNLYLYTLVQPQYKVRRETIVAIFNEAVDIAAEFIRDAMPEGLVGINAGLMIPYIQKQADNLLAIIGESPVYGVKHQLGFMDQINMKNITNIFERRVSEYSMAQGADTDANDVNYDF